EAEVVTAAPPAPTVEAPGAADTASRPIRAAAAAKRTADRKSVAKKATATKTAAKKAAAKSPAVHAPAAPAVPAAREKTTATEAAPAAEDIPAQEAPPAPAGVAKANAGLAGEEAAAPAPRAARASRRTRLPAEQRKLFVLDTNVLLHDSNSLFKFEEHDIYLPMIVLEELDHHKKGMSEVARNARQVSRFLDGLVNEATDLDKGVNLDTLGNQEALGQLLLQTSVLDTTLPVELPMGKADHVILGVVQALKALHPKRTVVLVSKDINIRLKARALGMHAEDYLNDRVIDDSDLLYDGVMPLPENFWLKHGKGVESWQQGGTTFYRVKGPLCSEFLVNQFVYLEGEMPLYAQVREVSG